MIASSEKSDSELRKIFLDIWVELCDLYFLTYSFMHPFLREAWHRKTVAAPLMYLRNSA